MVGRFREPLYGSRVSLVNLTMCNYPRLLTQSGGKFTSLANAFGSCRSINLARHKLSCQSRESSTLFADSPFASEVLSQVEKRRALEGRRGGRPHEDEEAISLSCHHGPTDHNLER